MLGDIKSVTANRQNLRDFGISVGIVLAIIGLLLLWKGRDPYWFFLGTAGLMITAGLLLPTALKPLYYPWMILAIMVGWLMTRIILSIMYYAIVSPIGIGFRLFGKKFLERKFDRNIITYWNERKQSKKDLKTLEDQF
mgnify:CR=1 FL=1|jgi:hypothetical protein